jgi:dienelactone hydrolase
VKTLGAALALSALLTGVGLAPAQAGARADDPAVGSPEYLARDTQNIADAYGRVTEQQLGDPAYVPALVSQSTLVGVAQLLEQAATPDRPSLTPGAFVPGWNVGNPYRADWDGTRGRMRDVAFTNRYGALLRGTVYAPLRRARDPYTGRRITGRLPGVVITEGSVQGSEGMYRWLAQDLAERGYLVLTYDVQGQGTSETLPHDGTLNGVPSQQIDNFVVGTRDALSFFTSTPREPYPDHGAPADLVDPHNPWHRLFDRRPDRRPNAPGRTTRIAVVGHSLGAAAVTQVQGVDDRVSTVVALDKLGLTTSSGTDGGDSFEPVVPALAVQSEYGFTVSPWFTAGGSSITPQPSPQGPDPRRERATGYDAWRDAGVDSMLVVPRASTHLEYTDIPLVLPASRWGQALTSAYVQRWLEHYLKHRTSVRSLLTTRLRYLEPTSSGEWAPVVLERDPLLSFYYCSAMHLDRGAIDDGDLTGVGC